MLSTDQKGAIAETAIAHEAIKLGIEVYKPVMDGSRCDFIFLDLHDNIVRVQCKWANWRGDVIGVRCYSSRRSAAGFVRRCYTTDEIDAVVAYCAELNRCYFLPIEEFPGQTTIQLRIRATRNSQQLGIHWAERYEFAARLGRPGAVAQLGERLAGSQ